MRESVTEERFRTGAYAVAENWALAAEFSNDSSGRHCFRVGKIVSAIALSLGISPESCLEMEFACRLHDIGKIVIDEKIGQRQRIYDDDGHGSLTDHTTAGARLLGCSSDPILKIASGVARHHHEWWNGCGYPDGLRGEAIPLEARICAIANAYDEFVYPGFTHSAWSRKQAVEQVCAMAGVQLDPNLVPSFLKAVRMDAATSERVADEVDRSMERNQLARAKKKLFETLELVD